MCVVMTMVVGSVDGGPSGVALGLLSIDVVRSIAKHCNTTRIDVLRMCHIVHKIVLQRRARFWFRAEPPGGILEWANF